MNEHLHVCLGGDETERYFGNTPKSFRRQHTLGLYSTCFILFGRVREELVYMKI